MYRWDTVRVNRSNSITLVWLLNILFIKVRPPPILPLPQIYFHPSIMSRRRKRSSHDEEKGKEPIGVLR
jgi:hypothetical protein